MGQNLMWEKDFLFGGDFLFEFEKWNMEEMYIESKRGSYMTGDH